MGKRKATPTTIVDQLREAMDADGRTSYRLWKDSGVSVPVIDRFRSGERDLRLETAAKLCAALGLELVKKS